MPRRHQLIADGATRTGNTTEIRRIQDDSCAHITGEAHRKRVHLVVAFQSRIEDLQKDIGAAGERGGASMDAAGQLALFAQSALDGRCPRIDHQDSLGHEEIRDNGRLSMPRRTMLGR